MEKMTVRSPLRYPGGKSKAVKTILKYLPRGLKTLVSPFMGGGSVELAVASKGARVYGYDAFEPLVFFWQAVLNYPESLAGVVRQYHPLDSRDFYELQKLMKAGEITDRQRIAAVFFALNRASFSGVTLSGGMSPSHPRFTQDTIQQLKRFHSPRLTVEKADFAESIARHPDDFLYCDPPYLLENSNLYGKNGNMHAGFDHQKLASLLKGREKWVLSYNDSAEIRDLYAGEGREVVSLNWHYSMNGAKKGNEILILSPDSIACFNEKREVSHETQARLFVV